MIIETKTKIMMPIISNDARHEVCKRADCTNIECEDCIFEIEDDLDLYKTLRDFVNKD